MSIQRQPGPSDFRAEREVAPKNFRATLIQLPISDVRFYGAPNGNFKSYVSLTIGGLFTLKHMRLVVTKQEAKAKGALLLSMPCRQGPDGAWKEYYHPIRREAREQLEAAVFEAYAKHMQQGEPVGEAGA